LDLQIEGKFTEKDAALREAVEIAKKFQKEE
jgi:transcription termination factor NusB